MRRRNSISEAWAARPIEMLESPAYRVLSLSAHRVLSRIEIEFAHHGGQDNGKLPVTFDDFARYGVRRHSIGPALLELEALGFIVITEHGVMAKAAEYRRSNRFLLTSRPKQKGVEIDGRWRQFKTMKEAKAAVEAAGQMADKAQRQRRPKEKTASAETAPLPVPKRHRKGKIASAETAPQGMAETAPLSISRGGDPLLQYAHDARPLAQPPDTAPTPASHAPAACYSAEPCARPRRTDAPFPVIDASYRIAGRGEPVVVFAAPRHTLPFAKPNDRSAHAVAAE